MAVAHNPLLSLTVLKVVIRPPHVRNSCTGVGRDPAGPARPHACGPLAIVWRRGPGKAPNSARSEGPAPVTRQLIRAFLRLHRSPGTVAWTVPHRRPHMPTFLQAYRPSGFTAPHYRGVTLGGSLEKVLCIKQGIILHSLSLFGNKA